MAEDFPVAFIFFLSDEEASQALEFSHNEEYDLMDLLQFHRNIIGFYLYSEFKHCWEFCLMNHYRVVSFKIYSLHLYTGN